MRSATYVSVLIRSHLRMLAPLPNDELLALKRSIAELATLGRNINQIAKAVNEGGRTPGSVREEFRAMLKIWRGAARPRTAGSRSAPDAVGRVATCVPRQHQMLRWMRRCRRD
jgi:hypothetical protein